MNRRNTALVAAAVALAVVAATPARDAISGLLGEPPPPPTAGEPEPAQVPSLTAEEQARAEAVVGSDAHLKRILAGRRATVKELGVWTTSRGDKIGAALVLALPSPTSIVADWPLIQYDKREASFPPYRPTIARFAAEGVSELMVQVDLGEGRVVSVQPGPEAKLKRPADFKPLPPSPDDKD